jgi:uncharacterized repeat protein (TIGR02543 family)
MFKLLSRVLCIALMSLLVACGGAESTKTAAAPAGVTFSFGKGALVSARTAKAARAVLATTVDPAAKYVLISATTATGVTVLSNFKADIYALNDGYLTAPIPLTPGAYKVTSFLVLDSSDRILYLVPTQTASADVKALVTTLLPMSFEVSSTQASSVALQVLAPDSDPADFGYQSVSFTPVSYVSFLSTVKVQVNGVWQATDASLKVNDVSYTHPAATSKLRVAQKDSYVLIVSKDGFVSQSITLTAAELANYQASALEIKLVPVPTYVTVTFDSNGGTAVPSQTVKKGDPAQRPANPTRPGYLFVDWFQDGVEAPFDFSTPIVANITLHARWILDPTHYFTWNGTGSITINGQLRTSPFLLPANVTKMTVVISGAAGGNGNTAGTPGEKRAFTNLPLVGATYTVTLGKAGKSGTPSAQYPIGGGGGGGASTLKVNGAYVAGAAGGAGGGDGGYSSHSAPGDDPGALGGSGDGPGGDGSDADGYNGLHGGGGNAGIVNTGGPAVGGALVGSQAADGDIEITIN